MNLFDLIVEKYPKLYITKLTNNELKFQPENDNGYVEYKCTLSNCSAEKATKYATQMQWRVTENDKNEYATYYIGVKDDGCILGLTDIDAMESIDKFVEITNMINARIIKINLIDITNLLVLQINVKIKKVKNNYLTDFT